MWGEKMTNDNASTTTIKFVVVDEYMSAREETLEISGNLRYTGDTYSSYLLWIDFLQNAVIDGSVGADWYTRKDIYVFCLGETDVEEDAPGHSEEDKEDEE